MPAQALPALTADDIDDLLYFTRTNEAQDLESTITSLAQKHTCPPGDIIRAAVDPETANTVFHYCAANGFVNLLNRLLALLGEEPSSTSTAAVADADSAGRFVNSANKEGNTPLHWAAYNGHLEVVKMLMAAGGDMWIKNAAGHLAMFEAERADRNDVVQFLLEAGGKEVERTGSEGVATAQDVEDVQAGPEEASVQAGANGDTDMSNGV